MLHVSVVCFLSSRLERVCCFNFCLLDLKPQTPTLSLYMMIYDPLYFWWKGKEGVCFYGRCDLCPWERMMKSKLFEEHIRAEKERLSKYTVENGSFMWSASRARRWMVCGATLFLLSSLPFSCSLTRILLLLFMVCKQTNLRSKVSRETTVCSIQEIVNYLSQKLYTNTCI